VQQSVGGAAGGRDPGHGVEKRPAVEEGSGGRACCGERHGQPPGALRGRCLLVHGFRGDQAVADAGDPEAVESDGHGVRREVAGARARPGAGLALELVELLPRGRAALEGAQGLPDVLDGHVGTAHAPRPHRPAVEHDRGLVDAGQRHQRGRHRLVAPDQADDRVEVMRMHHQLD
jgi:hypothetical protein